MIAPIFRMNREMPGGWGILEPRLAIKAKILANHRAFCPIFNEFAVLV